MPYRLGQIASSNKGKHRADQRSDNDEKCRLRDDSERNEDHAECGEQFLNPSRAARLGEAGRHVAGERSHGGHPAGSKGGPDGRHRGHAHTDQDRGQNRVAAHHNGRIGQTGAEAGDQRTNAKRNEHAQTEPGGAGHRPHCHGLSHHDGGDLPTAGPQGPEQPQFPGALAHKDGERVVDDEGRHHQDHHRESQHEVFEEPDELVEQVALFFHKLLIGHHLQAVVHYRSDGCRNSLR